MVLVYRSFCAVLIFLFAALPHRVAKADELSQAYLLPQLFEIMSAEGLVTLDLEGQTLFTGRALQDWRDAIAVIYQPERLERAFSDALAQELADKPDVREDALWFARSEFGMKILHLELSAREALLDDDIDQMARSAMDEARFADADTPKAQRLALVRDRIAANDLIELNVSLALNTSFAHYQGLLREDAIDGMGAEDLLRLVWAQEGLIRADLDDWIESYFLLSFQPLGDDELQAYIDYARTPKADAFNRAMFAAFDRVFTDVSLQVGQLMGRMMQMQEL